MQTNRLLLCCLFIAFSVSLSSRQTTCAYWQSTPGGGEMAFDWGQKVGENPTDAVLNHAEEIVDFVRLLHWNNIGWVADYDASVPGVAENALEIQKNLGYRFVTDEDTYDLNPDQSIR